MMILMMMMMVMMMVCSVYTGTFLDGGRDGLGVLADKTGRYEGHFAGGLRHGFGKQLYSSDNTSYEGAWENGKRHGKGKLHEPYDAAVLEVIHLWP